MGQYKTTKEPVNAITLEIGKDGHSPLCELLNAPFRDQWINLTGAPLVLFLTKYKPIPKVRLWLCKYTIAAKPFYVKSQNAKKLCLLILGIWIFKVDWIKKKIVSPR